MSHPVLIIGIGNEYRSDDAVGPLTARRLAAITGVRVIEEDAEGTDLIADWTDAQTVILIDAVTSGAPPGTIHRLDASSAPLPVEFFRCSTHAFSVAEAVELSRVLGLLPSRLIFYGIQGKNFGTGHGLSPEVAEAVDTALKQIRGEIEQSMRD